MKKHLKVFATILGYSIGFLFLASFIYLGIELILRMFGLRIHSELTGEFITDLAALPILILLFTLYTPQNRKKLFEGALSLKKFLLLIPISILARFLLLIGVVLLLVLFMAIVHTDLTSLIDHGLAYQWSDFDKSVGIVQVLGFLSFVVIGPITEELFNRGVVFNYLKEQYTVRTSIIYSSIIFMFLHFHPGLFLSSFILGVVLAEVYSRWKNIWYSIFLHMLINLHPFILTYFLGRQ